MSEKEQAAKAGQKDAQQNQGPKNTFSWPWQKREAYDAAYKNEKKK